MPNVPRVFKNKSPPGRTWHACKGQSEGRTAIKRCASSTSAVIPKWGLPLADWRRSACVRSGPVGKMPPSQTRMLPFT
eukprot:12775069-Heterocapsa_arctica.AAC.1